MSYIVAKGFKDSKAQIRGLEIIYITKKNLMLIHGHWDDHVLDRSYFKKYNQIQPNP